MPSKEKPLLLSPVRTSAPISPRSSPLRNSCRPSADYNSASAQHLTHQLRPGSQPSISSLSDSPVTSRKSSMCTPKHPTTLGAHNPLGHGSNQVHQSSTHTWHLQAFPTSMHRLSEPSSLMFRVTYLILGNVSKTSLLILTHNSRRNPYLDIAPHLTQLLDPSAMREASWKKVAAWTEVSRTSRPS